MRSHRSGKRLAVLGLVALGAIAILSGTKSPSHARQVVAVGPDRKELRTKLVALRGEIALMEVEHEAEREILEQKLMRVPIAEQQLRENSLDATKLEGFSLEQLDEEMLVNLRDLSRKLMSQGPASEELIRELREAKKNSKIADARRAFKEFFDKAQAGAKTEIEKELGPLRKEFARHASEVAAKRLDVEDAEHQYRGSR